MQGKIVWNVSYHQCTTRVIEDEFRHNRIDSISFMVLRRVSCGRLVGAKSICECML